MKEESRKKSSKRGADSDTEDVAATGSKVRKVLKKGKKGRRH